MDEKLNLKGESENIAKLILSRSISDQNELFDLIRRKVAEFRKEQLCQMEDENMKNQEAFKYAEESFKTIILGELK